MCVNDRWEEKEKSWVRWSYLPRWGWVRPTEGSGGPALDDLTGGRVTHRNETGDTRRDDWIIGKGKNAKSESAWTGWTEFIKKDPGWQSERGKDGSRRKEMPGKPETTVTTIGDSGIGKIMEALGMMPGMLLDLKGK